MKEVQFSGYNCVVKKSRYMDNENLALVLLDAETHELVAHVTVNTASKFPSDIAAVKDYSENKGMLKAITEAGLVKETMGAVQLGYVSAPIVKFNLDGVEEM